MINRLVIYEHKATGRLKQTIQFMILFFLVKLEKK